MARSHSHGGASAWPCMEDNFSFFVPDERMIIRLMITVSIKLRVYYYYIFYCYYLFNNRKHFRVIRGTALIDSVVRSPRRIFPACPQLLNGYPYFWNTYGDLQSIGYTYHNYYQSWTLNIWRRRKRG